MGRAWQVAERAGFEPAVGYSPTHAFQACDLNHSSISPEWGKTANSSGFQLLLACTIFMAELMRAETSVILLGTTSVVLASKATRL